MEHKSDLPTARRRSPPVTPEMAAKIKRLLAEGISQHDIAARFRINQGRVSEVKTGLKFAEIKPLQGEIAFEEQTFPAAH